MCVWPRTQVMIWNLDGPEPVLKNPVRTISHHTDVVLSMSFSTDGGLFATTCRDKKIRLVESRSGNLLQVSADRPSRQAGADGGVHRGRKTIWLESEN